MAQLGELDAEGRAKARLLARTITGRSGEQRELFEPLPSPSARVAKAKALILGVLGRGVGNQAGAASPAPAWSEAEETTT